MGSFNKNGIGTSIVAGNGNGFVEETVKMFDANSFVIAASSDMKVNVQNGTDLCEEALEGTTVIDNNQSAEANFQKKVLDKEASEVVGSGIVSSSDKDKACKITHGVHEICLAAVICNLARSP
jgi:hypothetical protein